MRKVLRSVSITLTFSWIAYCRKNPKVALKSLLTAPGFLNRLARDRVEVWFLRRRDSERVLGCNPAELVAVKTGVDDIKR